jgi:hypothetical protein
LKSLRVACAQINPEDSEPREVLALQALLLALRLDFPAFYAKHCADAPLLARFCPNKPSGPVIKLKRLAVTALASYL